MANPVVIQGQEVGDPHATANVTQHTKQAKCQDPMFAPLFYIDIIAIVAVAGIYGEEALNNTDDPFSEEYVGYYYSALIAGFVGLVMSALGLQVLMCIPQFMIKAGLIFSVVMAGFILVAAILNQNALAIAFGALFFAMSCCYAYCVWSRIPFATANLVTAMTAIKANCGIIVVGYIFSEYHVDTIQSILLLCAKCKFLSNQHASLLSSPQPSAIIAALWSFVWMIAVLGTFDTTYTCVDQATQTGCQVSSGGYGFLFLLFLAYFFTHQVIQVQWLGADPFG
jgi:hypothetical protein